MANTNPFAGFKLTGIDPLSVQTPTEGAKHELGIEVLFNDGTVRKYIRAGAAIAANDALTIDYAEGINDFHPTTAVALAVYAVSPVAVLDNGFAWVIRHGEAIVKVEDGVVAGEYLVSTAVSGELDTRIEGTTTAATATQMLALGASFAGTAPLCIAITTESTQDLARVYLR